MSFDQLRLSEPILRAIRDEGYVHPTPIQTQAIPAVLDGRDVLGSAQTGTGKTAAFALPLLQRMSGNGSGGSEKRRPIRTLILCPTRELAAQIQDSFITYGRHMSLRSAAIYGGVNQNPQVRALRTGIDVLIATPGRLFDLMNQGHVDLRQVQALVLDEADQMLDMGFIHDIRRIVTHLPKKRQTLLFSATMPPEIRRLADSILTDPVCVAVSPVASTVQTVGQQVYYVKRSDKPSLLRDLLGGPCAGRTLVFTRTKHGADRVVRDLNKAGLRAAAIHGNKSQNARTRALDAFKSRKPPILVATDIASRGIDVDDVAHVINFDLPNVPETYVHRIGRTARAGASGIAVSLCDPDERGLLKSIERLTRIPLTVMQNRPDAVGFVGPAIEAPDEDDADVRRGGANGGRQSRNWSNGRRNSAPKHKPSRGRPGAKPKPASRNSSAGGRGGSGTAHGDQPAGAGATGSRNAGPRKGKSNGRNGQSHNAPRHAQGSGPRRNTRSGGSGSAGRRNQRG